MAQFLGFLKSLIWPEIEEDEGLPDARIPAIITVKEEISVVEDTTTPLLQSGTTTPLQTDGSKAPVSGGNDYASASENDRTISFKTASEPDLIRDDDILSGSENPEYELDICYLSDFWYLQLTDEHRQWISDFRYFRQEREHERPGYLPAKIREWFYDLAVSNAWTEHGSEGPIFSPYRLVYWTDGSYFEDYPRSATGGIIFENVQEELIAVALSFDMDNISGSFDTELLTAIHSMKMGLQIAEDRIRNDERDCVQEIIIYLDCQRLLEWFRENRYSQQLGDNIKEMFYWADQMEKASIKLKMFWIPKKGQVEPHLLADRVAKDKRGDAFDEACCQYGRRYVDEVLVNLPLMPINRYVVREKVLQRDQPARPRKRQKTTHYRSF